jgi:acyl-coenzyme A thioesterase PaaI-like protein
MTSLTREHFNSFGQGHLPGLVGVEIITVSREAVESRMPVRREVMAPNAKGFTTVELKANFLGTARDGAIACRATPVHLGRTTQVWDAVVTNAATGAKIALFRCTQMLLWQNPKP